MTQAIRPLPARVTIERTAKPVPLPRAWPALARPGLAVTVLVDNEVARCGLVAVLGKLSCVASVSDATVPGGAHPAADIVIVSAANRQAGPVVEAYAQQAGPRPKVVVLLDDPADITTGTCTGADGYLVFRTLTPRALETALGQLVDGQLSLPVEVARLLLERATAARPRGRVRSATLTARETQTLDLLAQGLSNKQIARRLGLSEHGAKRLVASIMVKLDAPNRTLAVAIGLREGLITM